LDDLRVENYDAEEVSRKNQKILKRVAIASSTIGVVLSMFGLVVLGQPGSSRDISTPSNQVAVRENSNLPGGGGAWFFSWREWRDWSDWPD